MVAILSKLIDQLNSSVFVLLVVLVVSYWTVIQVTKWSQRFLHHEERLKDFSNLHDSIIKLETKVDLIYENTNPRKLAEAHSPISLTPLGEEVAKAIDANKIFEKYILRLEKEVALENPKNAYDIQTTSIKIAKEKMSGLLDEKELVSIKDEAFARGITVEDILVIFGILLRNHVLKQNGLPISDVDKHEKIKGQ